MTYSCTLILLASLATVCLLGCKAKAPSAVVAEEFPAFYREGHRGTRGLMPENTIPAMKKAVDVGANVLEVDVQISKDGLVVIAHDPKLNPKITLMPDGEEIPEPGAAAPGLRRQDGVGLGVQRHEIGRRPRGDE